jgi:hypothetical protein
MQLFIVGFRDARPHLFDVRFWPNGLLRPVIDEIERAPEIHCSRGTPMKASSLASNRNTTMLRRQDRTRRLDELRGSGLGARGVGTRTARRREAGQMLWFGG